MPVLDIQREYFSIEINQITGQFDVKRYFWGDSQKDHGRYRDNNLFFSKYQAEIIAEKIRELLKNQ